MRESKMNGISVKNTRIGDVLRDYGYVSDRQIEEALEYQKRNRGIRLGGALIALGFITETQMLDALACSLDLQRVTMEEIRVDILAVERLSYSMAQKYCILPIRIEAGSMAVVVNDPMNFYGLEDVRQAVGMELTIYLSEKAPLEKAITFYYAEIGARNAAAEANSQVSEEDLSIEEGDDETPIINLLNRLVRRAYSTGASDIHVEPFERHTSIRMRIDGMIVEFVQLQKSLHASLIARIKILSDLDIAEKRIPQDGHFRMNIDGAEINIRVSVLPTVFGEKAVLRLLATNITIDHSESFGMDRQAFERFSRILSHPNGIIYLTGPTGSGKSTTLYMILEKLSKRSVNISTIEDPVEKNIAKINQTQVNPMAGLTFETGLRALLRQDPDIIMVGETRDTETAKISVRAALTGHLVFSTLHTNDTASTVIRLVDMGLEPYLIANSVVGVVAQRLMRKVCSNCCEQAAPTDWERHYLHTSVPKIKRAKGCHLCNHTGYRGRVAIHEILEIDKHIRKMIADGAVAEEIREYAIANQRMKTLRAAGTELVEQGVTTIEELNKVAYCD